MKIKLESEKFYNKFKKVLCQLPLLSLVHINPLN